MTPELAEALTTLAKVVGFVCLLVAGLCWLYGETW